MVDILHALGVDMALRKLRETVIIRNTQTVQYRSLG